MLVTRLLLLLLIVIGGGWQAYLQYFTGSHTLVKRVPVWWQPIDIAFYPLMVLGFATYLLKPSWLMWANFSIAPAAIPAGNILLAIGLGLWIWTQAVLGENWTGEVALRPHHSLVTHGPYAYVRHPMYTAFITLAIGGSLASHNLACIPYILHTILVVTRAGKEEALLEEEFGQAYLHHKQQTGLFFPPLRIFKKH